MKKEMKNRMCLAALPVIILLSPSCGSDTNLAGDGSTDALQDPMPDELPPMDVPPDPEADDAPDDEAPGPGITFILSFITDIPDAEYLYAQSSNEYCRMTWISVLDGESSIPLTSDCSICTCEECSGCAVCGMCMILATRVPSGESIAFEWDGITYRIGTCLPGPDSPEISCENIGSLDPGPYTARFCWGMGDENAYPDDIITDPTCHDVPFTYPVPGGVVEYLVNNGG